MCFGDLALKDTQSRSVRGRKQSEYVRLLWRIWGVNNSSSQEQDWFISTEYRLGGPLICILMEVHLWLMRALNKMLITSSVSKRFTVLGQGSWQHNKGSHLVPWRLQCNVKPKPVSTVQPSAHRCTRARLSEGCHVRVRREGKLSSPFQSSFPLLRIPLPNSTSLCLSLLHFHASHGHVGRAAWAVAERVWKCENYRSKTFS